jgi:hypothetical protein
MLLPSVVLAILLPDVGSDIYVITFTSNRLFGLVDAGQMNLEGSITMNREKH